MTQRQMIEDAFRSGMKLTTWDAIKFFGCTRLAEYVRLLKSRGYQFEYEDVPKSDGAGKYRRYWLV